MIKARHNSFGFWLFVGASCFFTFLIICTFSQWYFNFTIIKISLENKREFSLQIFFMVAGLLLFIALLLDNVKNVTIDMKEGTIMTKNLFIPLTSKYYFKDLDGYIDTTLRHGNWTSYKCLCLVKKNKIILKIDSFYYSNIEENQQGLKGSKYLGFRKSNLFNTTKLS